MKNLFEEFDALTEDEKYDLGDIVFSPNRTDGVSRSERNTYDEGNLYFNIVRWVNSWDPLKQNYVDMIKDLMKSEKYGSFFSELEPGIKIYRGIGNVQPDKLAKWLGITDVTQLPRIGRQDGNWTMKPASGNTTSYTTDMYTAKDFSGSKYHGKKAGTFQVLLHANSADNPGILFDLERVLEKIKDSVGFVESEILALGPVNVSQISWKINNGS